MNDCCEEEVVEYEIEDAIVKSGSFGLLQIFVTIITMLIVFSVACQSLMLYYVADDPPWTCVAKKFIRVLFKTLWRSDNTIK